MKKIKSFRKILVPLDPNHLVKNALLQARDLVRKSKGQVLVYAVVEPVRYTNIDYFALPPGTNLNKQIIEDTRQKIKEFIRSLKVKCQLEVTMGVPTVEILKYAKKKKTDMIVLFSRKKGRLERLTLGCVSEAIARKARRPVWIIH